MIKSCLPLVSKTYPKTIQEKNFSTIRKYIASHNKRHWDNKHIAVLNGAEEAALMAIKETQQLYVYLPVNIQKEGSKNSLSDNGLYDKRRIEESLEPKSGLRDLLKHSPKLEKKIIGNLLELTSISKKYLPNSTTTLLNWLSPITKHIAEKTFSVQNIETLIKKLPTIRQTAKPWINFLLSEQPQTEDEANKQCKLFVNLIHKLKSELKKNDIIAIKASTFFTAEELKPNTQVSPSKINMLTTELITLHNEYKIKFVVDSEPKFDKKICSVFLEIAKKTNLNEDIIGITIAARYPKQSFTKLAIITDFLRHHNCHLSIKLVAGAPYGITQNDLVPTSQLEQKKIAALMNQLPNDLQQQFLNLSTLSKTHEETHTHYQHISKTIHFLNFEL